MTRGTAAATVVQSDPPETSMWVTLPTGQCIPARWNDESGCGLNAFSMLAYLNEYQRRQMVVHALASPLTGKSCNMDLGVLTQFLKSQNLIRNSRHLTPKVLAKHSLSIVKNLATMRAVVEKLSFEFTPFQGKALVVDVEQQQHILGIDLEQGLVHDPSDGTTREFSARDQQRMFAFVAFIQMM